MVVLPLALVVFELGRASSGRVRDRVAAAGRSLLKGHLILVVLYAILAAAVLTLYVGQRLSSVLGIYSAYSNSAHLAWGRLPRSLVEHLATFSLGVGVVPLVVALAWIGANVIRPSSTREAHAFACVSAFMFVVVFVQATNFDLVVNAYVHDRFLMYFVPVVLIGVALAVTDQRKPRWSLVLPLALVVAGFAFGDIPFVTWGRFDWMNLDTPISTIYTVLAVNLGAGISATRVELIAVAVIGTTLFVVGARRLRKKAFAISVFGFCAIAMTLATAAVFAVTFNHRDSNSRYVTQSQHGILDWVDNKVGPNANVTAIAYPISSDWFVNEEAWIDLEWFNKTIVRDATVNGQDPFDYLGIWFPKLGLSFDANTGAVAESPTRWVVQSQKETRFRIDGPAVALGSDGGALIDAGKKWRLAWLTSGLYDDGWTRPGVPMRMRVYSTVGQKHAELRSVAFLVRSAGAPLPFKLTSGKRSVGGTSSGSDTFRVIPVCVPAHGFGEAQLAVDGSSAIPGDLATYNESVMPRRGGVYIASLSVADEIGGPCKPG